MPAWLAGWLVRVARLAGWLTSLLACWLVAGWCAHLERVHRGALDVGVQRLAKRAGAGHGGHHVRALPLVRSDDADLLRGHACVEWKWGWGWGVGGKNGLRPWVPADVPPAAASLQAASGMQPPGAEALRALRALRAGQGHPPDLSRKVTTFSTAAASVRLRYEVPEAEISSLPSCTWNMQGLSVGQGKSTCARRAGGAGTGCAMKVRRGGAAGAALSCGAAGAAVATAVTAQCARRTRGLHRGCSRECACAPPL